jgi:hypothetical protein
MLPMYSAGVHKFSTMSRSCIQIPGTRRVTWRMFHTKDRQISRAIVKNVVAMAAWHPGFVYPWCSAT